MIFRDGFYSSRDNRSDIKYISYTGRNRLIIPREISLFEHNELSRKIARQMPVIIRWRVVCVWRPEIWEWRYAMPFVGWCRAHAQAQHVPWLRFCLIKKAPPLNIFFDRQRYICNSIFQTHPPSYFSAASQIGVFVYANSIVTLHCRARLSLPTEILSYIVLPCYKSVIITKGKFHIANQNII